MQHRWNVYENKSKRAVLQAVLHLFPLHHPPRSLQFDWPHDFINYKLYKTVFLRHAALQQNTGKIQTPRLIHSTTTSTYLFIFHRSFCSLKQKYFTIFGSQPGTVTSISLDGVVTFSVNLPHLALDFNNNCHVLRDSSLTEVNTTFCRRMQRKHRMLV